jgi:hypothetical protein
MEQPQAKQVESVGIAHVANSVTTLARAVKDLQQQMETLEERISDQEASSSFVNGTNARKKKAEFIRAYNAVISIMKALKIMPEMKDYMANQGNGTRDGSEQQPPTATPDKSAHLLRTIALTLTDMETVASYVSQDEVSTAEETIFSRPADFVKIEHSDSPNEIEERLSRSKEIDALKDFLITKDEQMQAFVVETKLQTHLLGKKSNRWIQVQLFCIILFLGVMRIDLFSNLLSDKIFQQKNIHFADRWKKDTPLNKRNLNLINEDRPESVEDERYINYNVSGHDARQDPILGSDNILAAPMIAVEEKDTIHESRKESIKALVIETAIHEPIYAEKKISTANETEEIVFELEDALIERAIQDNKNKKYLREDNTKQLITIERSWLEENLCEEFSDMMQCAEKKVVLNQKDRLSHMQTKDVRSLQRMMVRRQVFTAISVAAAMTLPKIAPHVFKINLAQILSLSFWRSLMEFITVLIQ